LKHGQKVTPWGENALFDFKSTFFIFDV